MRNKPHILCRIFGHKYTKRIKSHNMFVTDNMYCARCKMWSYDFPGSFSQIWHMDNGWIPAIRGKIRRFYLFYTWPIWAIVTKLKFLFNKQLKF